MKFKRFYFLPLILFLQHLPSFFLPIWSKDEGYWWAFGAAIARGGLLYRDAVDNRPPLFIQIYAWAIQGFGSHAFLALHLLVTLGNLLVLYLLYQIAREYFNESAGFWVAGFYLLLQGSLYNQELLAANAENFAMPLIVLSLFFYIRYLKNHRMSLLLLTSLVVGLAFYIRQTVGIQLAVFAADLLFRRDRTWKRKGFELFLLSAGFSAASLGYFFYFYHQGILPDFIFWVFQLPGVYVGSSELMWWHIAWQVLWKTGLVVLTGAPVWLLAFSAFSRWKKVGVNDRLWFLFFLAQSLTVFVGWRFSLHYYIQVFPAAALLAGWALHQRTSRRKWAMVLTCVAFGLFFAESIYRVAAQKNSFRDIGLALKERVPAGESLFIWGYYPAIYFYSGLPNASRFLESHFLSGQAREDVVPETLPPEIEKMWRWLFEDFSQHPPLWFLDTTTYPVSGRYLYPISRYSRLQGILDQHYEWVGRIREAELYHRVR